MPTGCAAHYAKLAPFPSSLVAATASAPSATASSATVDATSSKTLSAASRISAASPPVTDKLAANFLSGAAPATAAAFWL
jgi:hypothetical protein